MADRFSPEFVIDITTNVNAGQTATISGLGQAFELIDLRVAGSNGCTVIVSNNGSSAAFKTVNGIALGWMGDTTILNEANTSFSATAVITAAVTVANATRIELVCRAADAVARPVTVTVA
jgi:hypothetical protein